MQTFNKYFFKFKQYKYHLFLNSLHLWHEPKEQYSTKFCLPESWSPLCFLNHTCHYLCWNEVPYSYCWWHTVMHTPESWTQNNKFMILLFGVYCISWRWLWPKMLNWILTLAFTLIFTPKYYPEILPWFCPEILPWLWPWFLFLILTRCWPWFLTQAWILTLNY